MQMFYYWVSVTWGFCEGSGNREKKETESNEKSRVEERGGGLKEKDGQCWPLYKQAQQVSAPAFHTGE